MQIAHTTHETFRVGQPVTVTDTNDVNVGRIGSVQMIEDLSGTTVISVQLFADAPGYLGGYAPEALTPRS